MQKASKYISTIILILLAVLVIVTPLVGGVGITHASATTNNYTYVLYDLQKDSEFNENAYPEIADDYSLQMLQVAESVDDELFVYVYQPSGKTADLRATSINISKGYKTLQFRNYTLTFINSHKTLYKYKVDDFEVEDTRTRYYDITSIYRAWNKDYGDNETGNDNTISEVPFTVSTIYKLGVENGEFVVDTIRTDTIRVVSKFVGFVRYRDGYQFMHHTNCDSHFVAFSTDIPIDELYSADVYYRTQFYTHQSYLGGSSETFDENIKDCYASVSDGQDVLYEPTGWGNVGTICRDRLQTVDEFISSENFENVYHGAMFNAVTTSKLTDAGTSALRECSWVIRFAETPYTESYISGIAWSITTYEYIVSDVSILRLEGKSNGEYFNLGVIDNKQSGSRDPINDWEMTVIGAGKDILRIIKIVLAVLAGIIIVVFVCWLIRIIFKPIKAIDKTVKTVKKKNKR